ncbi:MAG: zinc-dependent alcohol dehydrogenase [Rubrobacteraceae bacterium]
MKGIRILGDRRTELVTMDRPESRDGWVLVRSTMSAVCGSDLHIYRQTAEQVGHRAQRIAGHEAVGVIEEVGSGVESLKAGDRVVVYQHFGCGRCSYCRIGEPMFCPERQTLGNHVDGADGDLVHIPASSCLPLPDGLSDEVGALVACNFGTAFSGVRKLSVDGGDVLVVFGLGPVGCCATIVAASDGADVIVVDPVKSRRELAMTLGASHAIDPANSNTGSRVLEITDGRGAECSVDTSGNPAAQAEALDVLRANGRMLVLAATSPWTLDPSQLWRRGLTVFGSWVYGLGEYEKVVHLAESRSSDLERLVTRRFSGGEGEEAFRVAAAGEEGKVVIDWTR